MWEGTVFLGGGGDRLGSPADRNEGSIIQLIFGVSSGRFFVRTKKLLQMFCRKNVTRVYHVNTGTHKENDSQHAYLKEFFEGLMKSKITYFGTRMQKNRDWHR